MLKLVKSAGEKEFY